MNEAGPSGSKAGPAGVVLNNRMEGHVRDYDTEHPSWGQTAEATKDQNCIHKFNFSMLSFPDCLLTPDLAKLLLPWKFGCRSLLHALPSLTFPMQIRTPRLNSFRLPGKLSSKGHLFQVVLPGLVGITGVSQHLTAGQM